MVRSLSLLATALLAPQIALCWTTPKRTLGTTQLGMASPPAGSFFNPVPDDNGEEPKSRGGDIDDQVGELLRRRKNAPRASRPSTINGVPTAKVKGFGKSQEEAPAAASPSSKPYVAIGPPDQKINDPTKPEYDDQGYTLYQDESTGKKSRVFEALVDYPCEFTMKIVGAGEGTFVEDMVAIVAEACETDTSKVPYSIRAMGKWTSVTVKAPVKDAVMLYTLYEKVDLDPRVKFKF